MPASLLKTPGTAQVAILNPDHGQSSVLAFAVVASGCTYALSPVTGALFATQAGTGSVGVTTQAGCAWATSSDQSWMTVSSGATGSGSGTVNYSVTANTGLRRTGTLMIAGLAFPVAQAAYSGEAVTQTAEILTSPRSSATGTVLLFPWAVNLVGYDTEITISNTSQDTLGSASGSGTCTLNYYGTNAPSAQTTSTIAAGSQLVFSLSEAGLVNFSGYLIANCGFPLARGYAKVLTRGSVMGFAQDAQALTVPRAQSTPQRLLFPYLTNTSGYESGIEIANTSQDPFGTVQSSGYCYLNFYGQNQPPALVVLTDSSGVWPIAPGTIRANTLSGLGLINFQGYAIATCNFGSSAGIAFVQTRTQSQGNSVLPEILTTPRDTTARPLLFTSLSNQNGRDSAIVISNTSLDPFGTVSSHGTCGLSFYGATRPAERSRRRIFRREPVM